MTKQKCKARPKVININSDDPLFYPYNILINKFRSSCDNVNDPHAKLCVPDVVKSINVKVFNPMSRNCQIRYMKWHETCRCKCRLDASVCIVLADKLVEECSESIDENEMISVTLNGFEYVCMGLAQYTFYYLSLHF